MAAVAGMDGAAPGCLACRWVGLSVRVRVLRRHYNVYAVQYRNAHRAS